MVLVADQKMVSNTSVFQNTRENTESTKTFSGHDSIFGRIRLADYLGLWMYRR